MRLSNTESVTVPAARAAVFKHAFDLEQMPKLLRGWGPVPGVERVELLAGGEYAVGKVRRIFNTDGSSLDEEILIYDPPSAHSYRLYGEFQGLAKLLVCEGRGDWEFVALGPSETEVRWRYEFTLTSALAAPVGLIMMKIAFANMQRGTLKRLRAGFA